MVASNFGFNFHKVANPPMFAPRDLVTPIKRAKQELNSLKGIKRIKVIEVLVDAFRNCTIKLEGLEGSYDQNWFKPAKLGYKSKCMKAIKVYLDKYI